MLSRLYPSRGVAARLLAMLTLTVAALSAASCSATDKGDSAPKPFEASITARELARLPGDSPRATVMRLWRDAQLGNTPGVVGAYDRRVRQALGSGNIAGAYAVRRSVMAASRPTVSASESTPEGRLLTLRVTSTLRDGKPVPAAQKLPVTTESFLLREDGNRWVVAHDSLLEPALTEYRISLEGGRDSTTAVRAGRRLAERYRSLFLSPPPAP